MTNRSSPGRSRRRPAPRMSYQRPFKAHNSTEGRYGDRLTKKPGLRDLHSRPPRVDEVASGRPCVDRYGAPCGTSANTPFCCRGQSRRSARWFPAMHPAHNHDVVVPGGDARGDVVPGQRRPD